MAEHDMKNWRELCNEAIAANDMDELLKIIDKLNAELDREQKMRKHFTTEERLASSGAALSSQMQGN